MRLQSVGVKDVGKTVIVDAHRFVVLGTIDTGLIANHVNFVIATTDKLAYVIVGGENAVKVYRRNDGTRALVATIPTGDARHEIWPSQGQRHNRRRGPARVVRVRFRLLVLSLVGEIPASAVALDGTRTGAPGGRRHCAMH